MASLLDSVLGSLGNVRDLASETGESIDAQTAAVNEANARLDGKQEALTAQQQEVLKMRQMNAQATSTANELNPDQANNAIARLTTERKALELEQKALYDEIRTAQKTGFFDDPLAWIVNRYTVNDTIEQHNTVVDRRNTVSANLMALTDVAKAEEAARWYGISSNSAIVAKTESDMLAFKAMEDSFKRTKELAAFNISAEGAALNANSAVADMQVKQWEVRNKAESMQMQRESHKKQMEKLSAADKTEEYYKKLADGMSRFYNGATLDPIFVQRVVNSPGPEGVAARWMEKAVVTGSAIGNSAGEAIVASDYLKVDISKNKEAQAVASSFIPSVTTEAIKRANKTPSDWKKLGPEEQARVIDAYVDKEYGEAIQKKTIVIGENSPYYAPTVGNLLEKTPDLESNVLWKAGLSQLPKDAQLNHKTVLAQMEELVRSGAYGSLKAGAIERAVEDVVKTYERVNLYTAEQRGMKTIFNLPPMVGTHRVNTGEGMLSPLPAVIDMANKTEVTRWAVTKLVPRTTVFTYGTQGYAK